MVETQDVFKITVDKKFILQRNKRAKLYKANGRSKERLLKDIECELFEYDMIKKGKWEDDDNWQVDGHAFWGTVDVKCIKGFYNISRKKLIHILQQRDYVDWFYFIEWNKRPERLLKTGDNVEFKYITKVPYEELLKHIKVSFKTDGYYYDARKAPKIDQHGFPGQ